MSGQDTPDEHGDVRLTPKIPNGPTPPNPARIYDYWLGGRDHFGCDRQVGDEVAALAPWAPAGARACRAYLRDAVTWLAAEGIDQFLDIGSGLPTAGNVHQLAQLVNREVRVVYVDHDPVVLAYGRALIASDPGVLVMEGDLRDPAQILDAVRSRPDMLDLGRPVAILLSAIMHFIADTDDPAQILATLRAAMAPGSYVLISHVVADDDAMGRATRAAAADYSVTAAVFVPRTTAEIVALFDGFDIVPPGVHSLAGNAAETAVLGGIGRFQLGADRRGTRVAGRAESGDR